jgi:hypothetical protein
VVAESKITVGPPEPRHPEWRLRPPPMSTGAAMSATGDGSAMVGNPLIELATRGPNARAQPLEPRHCIKDAHTVIATATHPRHRMTQPTSVTKH